MDIQIARENERESEKEKARERVLFLVGWNQWS